MIIYKTTNKINGKFYIGKDVRDNPSYFGSGIRLKRAIKKYGIENFVKEVVETCETIEQLSDREVFWIKELGATDKSIGYNIASGGDGGDTSVGMTDKEKKRMIERRRISLRRTFSTPEARKRRTELSSSFWKRDGYVEKMSKVMTGRKITWSDKISKSLREWSKTHKHPPMTEETRKKIALASKRTYVDVSQQLEDRIVSLYAECGPRRMSSRLSEEGTPISPYVIIRTLKKRGVYEKYRKMRPELKA